MGAGKLESNEVVEHSAQPDLTLAALSFCIAACFVVGLRVVIAT